MRQTTTPQPQTMTRCARLCDRAMILGTGIASMALPFTMDFARYGFDDIPLPVLVTGAFVGAALSLLGLAPELKLDGLDV